MTKRNNKVHRGSEWLILLGSALLIWLLVGCGAASAPPAAAPEKPAEAPQAEAKPTEAPQAEEAQVSEASAGEECPGEMPIVGKGPNGEEATPLSELSLTAADEAKIREGKFKVAIAMHYLADDWPQLQVKGISETLGKYGVEVIAATDGELKAEKQIADIESLIELKPDIILTIPVDNDALAAVTKKVVDSGIRLVLIDSKPTGLEPGKDYLGLGASDNYAIGAIAADVIGEELSGKGKVAILRWGNHVFQTEQRREGALETFKSKYPDMEIVFDEDVHSVEEAATVCENLLTKDPDIKGFWTAWDGMGTACVQTVVSMGYKDVVVTTVDLSRNSGLLIAKGSPLKATGAQHPYDQGIAEAMIALYGMAGKEPPTYVVVPGRRVTKDNILCAMEAVFHEPPPQEFAEAVGGK